MGLFVVLCSLFVTKLTSLCIISLIRLRVSAMDIMKLEAMFIFLAMVERVERLKSLKVEMVE